MTNFRVALYSLELSDVIYIGKTKIYVHATKGLSDTRYKQNPNQTVLTKVPRLNGTACVREHHMKLGMPVQRGLNLIMWPFWPHPSK